MYLTYEEYQAYGGTMAQADYALAELKARKRIDSMTQGRIAGMVNSSRPSATPLGEGGNVPDEVKAAMFEIIQVEGTFGASAQASAPVVASFTTDGYSESYGSAESRAAAAGEALRATVERLLYGVVDDEGVPLLFTGIGCL